MRHIITAFALQRIAHADKQCKRVGDLARSVIVDVIHEAAHQVKTTGKLTINKHTRAGWAARLRDRVRRPMLYMGAHGYLLAGRETGGTQRAAAKTIEGGVGFSNDKDAFILKTDWRGLETFITRCTESSSATVGAKMLRVFTDAAAFRDPDTGRGKTPADIADELLDLGEDFTDERAELLAQTGSIFAYNEGAMQRYADDGVAAMEWLTADDDLTCPFCLELNGQRVEPKDDFFATGDTLSAGGESMTFKWACQHPPAHPRCRCTVIPLIDERQI